MGIIDKSIHRVECEQCSEVEEQAFYDKGSIWGGSSWQSAATFQKFNVSWSGGGKIEPDFVKALCKGCGREAKLESRYSGI